MLKGSGISPETTDRKFFIRHFAAYDFVSPFSTGKRILEIGHADGYGADFLAGKAEKVIAVDVEPENVEFAGDKYSRPNLEFLNMDALDLKFPNDVFDIVVSFQVVEHIERNKLDRYLAEIKRVLCPKGIVFISTLNLKMNMKHGKVYVKNPYHDKEFTYTEFVGLMQTVFGRVDIYGLFVTPKHAFYERLKKLGIFRYFPQRLNIVDMFYSKIDVRDFMWKKCNFNRAIDFMAVCKKETQLISRVSSQRR